MATYVVEVKLPYERTASRFGILHSTSETLFSPTFSEDEELLAHMFAAEYCNHHFLLRDYTEAGQEKLTCDLRAFLQACFPAYQETLARLPADWRALLAPCYEDDESEVLARLDVDDLLEWYRDGDTRADVVQGLFHSWRNARRNTAAVGL